MGFKSIDLKLPTAYAEPELIGKLKKIIKSEDFSYFIEKKSLDARKKDNIHWKIRVGVYAKTVKGGKFEQEEKLQITNCKGDKKVVVTGSGPAGFFSAFILQQAGFQVTLIEQGKNVDERAEDIKRFEESGVLDNSSNYSFGEGGAGTFSDGKLTSRTKRISKEKKFIFESYIKAGAPEEIAYLSQPHLGSDNLKKIVRNLRHEFERLGGKILFKTKLEDLKLKDGTVKAAVTNKGEIAGDYFVIAPGHSSYDTYEMLIKNGIPFKSKSFAIGCRVEHPQKMINMAQWNQKSLPGVKAAEYKLTFKKEGFLPVYSFCMCPGGKVVPASPVQGLGVVNGMSNYKRNSDWANSAIVAGINLNELLEKEVEPLEAINWLRNLEEKYYNFSNSYKAPAVNIGDFIASKISSDFEKSSYPFDLVAADFRTLLPEKIAESIAEGMKFFCDKIKGFEKGTMIGLESKTSAPVQAIREKSGKVENFQNLYISGEGSGFAGGIISSAADGIRAAMDIISREQ